MKENDKVEEVKVEEVSPKQTAVTTTDPSRFIELAIMNNADIDKLERIMQLKERYDKEEARKAFFQALSNFQAECPVIKKDKKIQFATSKGEMGYNHATLGAISEAIREPLRNNGLSYRWKFDEREDKTVTTCVITHIQGHSEESSMTTSGKEDSGTKNDIQAIGSARTYTQRYTLIAALGLTTAEDDTDAISKDLTESLAVYYKNLPQRVQLFLKSEASKISSKRVFEEWLMKLPTESHVQELQKLLPKIHPSKQDELWITFIKQNTDTVGKFLTNLTQSLTQGATK